MVVSSLQHTAPGSLLAAGLWGWEASWEAGPAHGGERRGLGPWAEVRWDLAPVRSPAEVHRGQARGTSSASKPPAASGPGQVRTLFREDTEGLLLGGTFLPLGGNRHLSYFLCGGQVGAVGSRLSSVAATSPCRGTGGLSPRGRAGHRAPTPGAGAALGAAAPERPHAEPRRQRKHRGNRGARDVTILSQEVAFSRWGRKPEWDLGVAARSWRMAPCEQGSAWRQEGVVILGGKLSHSISRY